MHSLVQLQLRLREGTWLSLPILVSHGPKPSIGTKQKTKKSLQCTSSLATYQTYGEHISNMIKGFWNHNRGLWVTYGHIMSRQPRAPSYCYLPIKWDINSIAIGSQGPQQRRHFTVHRLWRKRNQALNNKETQGDEAGVWHYVRMVSVQEARASWLHSMISLYTSL